MKQMNTRTMVMNREAIVEFDAEIGNTEHNVNVFRDALVKQIESMMADVKDTHYRKVYYHSFPWHKWSEEVDNFGVDLDLVRKYWAMVCNWAEGEEKAKIQRKLVDSFIFNTNAVSIYEEVYPQVKAKVEDDVDVPAIITNLVTYLDGCTNGYNAWKAYTEAEHKVRGKANADQQSNLNSICQQLVSKYGYANGPQNSLYD